MPFAPIPREKVLGVIEKLGPVQPIDIRKELKEGDSMLIGAMLSEMAANGIVAISKTKRGGSPFYYDPRHPEALAKAAPALGEKDRRTFAFLQEQGVVREDTLEPLTRVSLGNIPDFSRRFTVALNGVETAFWRYYMIPEDEAKARAMPVLEEKPVAIVAPAVATPVAVPIVTTEEKAAEKPKKAPRKRAPSVKRAKKVESAVAQTTIAPVTDVFADRTKAYFKTGTVSEMTILKPETETTCVHTVAGPHGTLHTFVYASAKKLTEKMVLAQLLVARGKGMPLLVLATEELSKKLTEFFDETPNVHHAHI